MSYHAAGRRHRLHPSSRRRSRPTDRGARISRSDARSGGPDPGGGRQVRRRADRAVEPGRRPLRRPAPRTAPCTCPPAGATSTAPGAPPAGTPCRRRPDHGGQGLPHLVNAACIEMWNAASMAFGLGPLLTMSAVEALAAHGSDRLKRLYLGKLVSGEWMGTMNITEPQAGSDLGALRTRAERQPDGSYRLRGTKVFITYGEHDLTDNIIHLVLARLPDAPERHARPVAVPGAQGAGGRRRHARRPQRRGVHRRREEARHPRLAHLHHAVRRPRAARSAI